MKQLSIALILISVVIGGCKKNAFAPSSPSTVITELSPTVLTAGGTATIKGLNLLDSGNPGKIMFNGETATVQSYTATEIKVTVPATSSGRLTMTMNNGSVNGPSFTYTAIPRVTQIAPNRGFAGVVVTIKGENFGTSKTDVQVLFNGVSAMLESISETEIKVVTPASSSGNIVVIRGGLTLDAGIFSYSTFTSASYTSGNVILTSQAEVDRFVELNKGKQLNIDGILKISGDDITSLSGLSNIITISHPLTIQSCPKLKDVSFLNSITSAFSVTLADLPVTGISMDNLSGSISNMQIISCPELRAVSFKSLKSVNGTDLLGGFLISGCGKLTTMNFNSLETVKLFLKITGTSASDLNGFNALRSVGSLNILDNPMLTSLNGLEQLAEMTMPAINRFSMTTLATSPTIGGLTISGNNKLKSVTALTNLKTCPIIEIANNSIESFCPLKALLTKINALPDYSYQYTSPQLDRPFTRYVSALTLSSNGAYASKQSVLDAVANCN